MMGKSLPVHAPSARRASRVAPLAALAALAALLCALLFPSGADAAYGSFRITNKEVQESASGLWRVAVTIELPKAPLTAHQPMRFIFTKTMVFERSLVDGQKDPVVSQQVVQNDTPAVESLDVGFADASGKIFKGTRFDFGLKRERGYVAGEYKVELRTADGTNVGSPATLLLKGDNPVVDRRAMAFNASSKGIKKVEGYDAGANQAKADEPGGQARNGPAEVTPTGTATGFVPAEGMQETEEEKIKTKPGGCGCFVPGASGAATTGAWLAPLAGLAAAALRRRRNRSVR